MNPDQVAELIRTGLPGAVVTVRSPDGTHFEAEVIAQEFSGKRMLQRHQMVYATLGDLVGGAIHALSLSTKTPEET